MSWNNRLKRDVEFLESGHRRTAADLGTLPAYKDFQGLTGPGMRGDQAGGGDIDNDPHAAYQMLSRLMQSGQQDTAKEMFQKLQDQNPRMMQEMMSSYKAPWLGTLLMEVGDPQQSEQWRGTPSQDNSWRPGTNGRGLITNNGQFHLWPEELGTHQQYAQKNGIDMANVATMFGVSPEGGVDKPVIYRTSNPEHEQMVHDHFGFQPQDDDDEWDWD